MRILMLDGAGTAPALRSQGHEVLTAGAGQGYDLALDGQVPLKALRKVLEGADFTPEAVIWCGAGAPPAATGYEVLSVPVLGLSTAPAAWHGPYSTACDAVLVAGEEHLASFGGVESPREATALPASATPEETADAAGARLAALAEAEGWRWRVEHPYPVRRDMARAFKLLAADESLPTQARDGYRKLSVIYMMAQ